MQQQQQKKMPVARTVKRPALLQGMRESDFINFNARWSGALDLLRLMSAKQVRYLRPLSGRPTALHQCSAGQFH